MTTFQTLIYAVFHGFSLFLPIGASAHDYLIGYFFSWPVPEPAALGAMSLGGALALFVYFRHDWASVISSLLQIVIFRRKPMTLDERLPFFIALSSIPFGFVWYYSDSLPFGEWVASPLYPLWVAAGLSTFALILLLAERMGRKHRKMFDWNWIDALWMGLAQLTYFLPGVGRQVGVLAGATFRNYSQEAALKYGLLSFLPVLIVESVVFLGDANFGGPKPSPDLSWLSFGVAGFVSFFAGLLAIGGLMKAVPKKGFRSYSLYRIILAMGATVIYFIR